MQYSDQILAEFGTDWADWRLLEMSVLPVARRLQIKADIRQIIEEDYADAELIVVKDPRICRFPGFFMEALAESGYRIVPVIASRNPLEVMESLQKREAYWAEHMRRSDAALLWLSHQLEIERATRGMARVLVGYDDLLSDWKAIMARVEREGGIRFPLRPDMAAREIEEFLTPARRSHRHTVSDVRLEPDLHGWVADTYEALRRLEDGRDAEAQMRTLDRVYKEFRATVPLLAGLTSERRRMQDDASSLKVEVNRLGAEASALAAARNEAELRSRQAQAELDGLRNDLRDRQKQIAALLAETQGLEATVQDLREKVRHIEARLAQSAAEVADAAAEAQRLAKAKTVAEEAAAALRAQLDQARNAITEKSAELDRAVREGAETRQMATRLQTGSQHIVGLLNAAREDTYRTHLAYRHSTSWRLTAPLRWVSSLVRGRSAKPVPPEPLRYEDHFGPTVSLPSPGAAQGAGNPVSGNDIVFFTICSRNFMAFARTLHKSLIRFYPQARLVVALCDEATDHPPFVAADEPFEFLHLDDLNIPDWHGMSQRYNVTEFNTAIKPFVFLHLFERQKADFVVYFDPDIYIVDHLSEIENAFGNGADVILTPHMLEPNERAEMNERRLLQYGIYNLGFVGIARTAKAIDVVRWWGRRLERECIIKREEGLFVDQKWADHFPAFFAHPHILHHPGYNIAYWNLSNRKVTWAGDRWLVNGMPARFVHFSGNNLDDPSVLSRHSGEHRADTIGDLKILLDEYRTAVFANGHAEFRKIPYAFSWGGHPGSTNTRQSPPMN